MRRWSAWVWISFLGSLAAPGLLVAEEAAFLSAKPVWMSGRETEMNLTAGFRAVFPAPPAEPVLLRVAAATLYRAWVNGRYVAHGPARGPHGYFRIDEWDISEAIVPGENLVAIEVVGYNTDGHYQLDQASFLQAEVVAGGRGLVSTAGDGIAFEAAVLDERVQKTCRFSSQRTFTEVYRLTPGYDGWRRDAAPPPQGEAISELPETRLLPRGVLLPALDVREPVRGIVRGRLEPQADVKRLWEGPAGNDADRGLKGFGPDELEANPVVDVQMFASVPEDTLDRSYPEHPGVDLPGPSYEILDFGRNLTGFLGAKVTCTEKTTLWFLFDEVLTKREDVDFTRQRCVRVVSYELAPGEYCVETIEPYTLRYLKLASPEGHCVVEDVILREYAHPEPNDAHFAASDERLNDLFAAGVLTHRQNALDLFTNCPSRERSGRLCDAFFTARATYDLTGSTRVERNFFENFLMPETFAGIPTGMLPMCYPADPADGKFIPNWALWFVVQLEEYAARSGDRETVEGLRPKVMDLLEYFESFEGESGLLENLPGWNFVTYSSEGIRWDLNYPTNMLYAGALSAAARLYGVRKLESRANKIRIHVLQQSFDGHLFADAALGGKRGLTVTADRTEACQYFAFYFDVVHRAEHRDLWHLLRRECGVKRRTANPFGRTGAAQLFIGKMLRLELLSEAGLAQLIVDESISYWHDMAERTGTLWEFSAPTASCCHGYASHVVHVLYRDILGIYDVDTEEKVVQLRFCTMRLDACEGSRPIPGGRVSLSWWKEDNRIAYHVNAPAGYRIEIENQSGRALVEQ